MACVLEFTPLWKFAPPVSSSEWEETPSMRMYVRLPATFAPGIGLARSSSGQARGAAGKLHGPSFFLLACGGGAFGAAGPDIHARYSTFPSLPALLELFSVAGDLGFRAFPWSCGLRPHWHPLPPLHTTRVPSCLIPHDVLPPPALHGHSRGRGPSYWRNPQL